MASHDLPTDDLRKATRAKPDSLLVPIATPTRLPIEHGPVWWHLVLAVIAAKGDSEEWVVAIINCPILNLMSD